MRRRAASRASWLGSNSSTAALEFNQRPDHSQPEPKLKVWSVDVVISCSMSAGMLGGLPALESIPDESARRQGFAHVSKYGAALGTTHGKGP